MPDALEWFLTGGDWYDWRQEKRLETLDTNRARGERRIRQANAATESRLVERINRLEAAFSAFVELEDAREDLTAHAPDATVRRHLRSLLLVLPQFGGSVGLDLPPLPDTPAYWLAATADWTQGLLAGDVVDPAQLDEARRRDQLRTDLYEFALSCLTGRIEQVGPAVDRLVSAPWAVSDWQRIVWRELAAGRAGPEGRRSLVVALRGAMADADSTKIERSILNGSAAADTSVPASRQLRVLDARVTASKVPNNAVEERPITEDPLAQLLAVLVDEGAPGEVEVLDRMSSIRAVLASKSTVAPPERASIDRVVGDVDSLINIDLADDTAEQTALRSVAIDACAAQLVAVADRLVAAVDVAPRTERTVTIEGEEFTVTADGTDRSAWMAVIDARTPIPADRATLWKQLGVAGIAVAVIGMCVALISAGVGVLVAAAGLIAVIAAFSGWSGDRSRREVVDRRRASALPRAERLVDNARQECATDDAEGLELVSAAAEHHASIRSALAR